MYYIYAYIDPRNNLPFYIGKGSGNRYLCHLSETKDNTENRKKYAYIQGLRNKKLEPRIIKLHKDIFSEAVAYDIEEAYIKLFGRKGIDPNGILTNICADARPPRIQISDEQRQKRSLAMIGNTHGKGLKSPFRGKKRPELSGANNGFYGKSHTEETRSLMRQKAIGRPGPMLGRNHSEEAKRKVQLNNPNRRAIQTPEGTFMSAEEYATITKKITANGLRNLLNEIDNPITKHRAERCPLLSIKDIGKTPREKGYYYI